MAPAQELLKKHQAACKFQPHCTIFGFLVIFWIPLGRFFVCKNAFLGPAKASGKFESIDLDRPEAAWVPAERFLA